MPYLKPTSALGAYDPSPKAIKNIAAFATLFESSSRGYAPRLAGGGFQPLRLVWVGSSSKRWACVAMREADFDLAILRLCQSSSTSSFPWAHGPRMLGQLALSALAGDPEAQAVDLAFHPNGPAIGPDSSRESSFSALRTRNFTRYFAVPFRDEAKAASLLLRELPNSWILCAHGVALDLAPAPGFPIHAPLELPGSLSYFHHGKHAAPYAQTQVDGDGNAFILWLPAAARALGAPTDLSVSAVGCQLLLGLGDILGAANRMASDAPELFRELMAEALMPLDVSKNIDIQLSQSGEVFIARDRRSVIAQSSALAASGQKGPRL